MWLCSSSTSIIEDRDLSAHLNILTIRGGLSRNPWSVSIRRQQRAIIANPGMQWSAPPAADGDMSGLLSAAKSASMLLKNRSLIRLSKTPIAFNQASSSSSSSLFLRSFHSLLRNPKHRAASMAVWSIVHLFSDPRMMPQMPHDREVGDAHFGWHWSKRRLLDTSMRHGRMWRVFISWPYAYGIMTR